MEQARLYLLVDRARTKFKIGITVDVRDRALTLSRMGDTFDLDASYEVADDPLSITRLEKVLHYIFRAWNVKPASPTPGFTEWFDIVCLPEVLLEIERIGKYQNVARTLKRGVSIRRRDGGESVPHRTSLASLLFPEYRYRVLKLLFSAPDDTHHVREIARMTSTVAGTVNKELKALERAGLLQAKRAGNHVMYCANRSSAIFRELRDLIAKV